MKLFGKYKIEKADGSPIDPEAKYFVLRYDAKSKDRWSRMVLERYAELCKFFELAEDVEAENKKAWRCQLTREGLINPEPKEGEK